MDAAKRTVRLPIVSPDADTWKELRALACLAARFGNLALADLYAAAARGVKGEALRAVQNAAYKRMNDDLSGWVRGAMMRNRVMPYWRRSRRDVLAGRARLACFSADKSLIISADQRNNQGAIYCRDGDKFFLACRFRPVEVRDANGKLVGTREPMRLEIAADSPGARADWFLREALEKIWGGVWLPGTVALRLDRTRRKLDALISYERPAPARSASGLGATLGPYRPETGELWLRIDGQPDASCNYANAVHRMLAMKQNHEAIIRRLRARMGRGPRSRQRYRKKLRALGSYSGWVRGRMHELSADVVKRCVTHGAGTLRLLALGAEDLPWHMLRQYIRYKCQDAGITLDEPNPKQDATYRALRSDNARRARSLKRVRLGLDEATALVSRAGG